VDLERASASIDDLIDKGAAGREEGAAAEMAWKASVRRHNAKLRDRCLIGERREKVVDDLQRMADEAEGGGGLT
jgi:hypothetical protein